MGRADASRLPSAGLDKSFPWQLEDQRPLVKRFKARIYSLFIRSVIPHLLFHFNLSHNLKDEHDLVIQFF